MNSVNITGRLTTDPELRALPSGENVCKLRLAVDGLAPKGKSTGYVDRGAFRRRWSRRSTTPASSRRCCRARSAVSKPSRSSGCA